jgi:hypothetical protein
MSMEEYRARWQPEGWQLIIIGPTSTWRQEWGGWEAIRDIVQNALDEAEAYRWGYDSEGLWIADRGRGVAVSDFLLGPPKLKPDWARGKYGEGMKIASLALVRKGYHVHIETVGRELWIIFLEQAVDGTAETLAALWRPDGRVQGTEFHIIGYTGPAFSDRFAVNLPRSSILAETPSPLSKPTRRYNQLIDYGFPTGSRIYARDIYMRELNSLYSYNLWGFDMAPDRFGPKNEPDMWTDMGRVWACVKSANLLEKFLQMVREPPVIETAESHQIIMSGWGMGTEPVSGKGYTEFVKDNASSWQQAWQNDFGENAVMRTTDRWDGTVKHLGYVPVSIHYGVENCLRQVITTDEDLVKASQERLRDVEVIPDQGLTPRQLASLKLARAVADRLAHWMWGPVMGVHAAIIPPASDRVRTAGMYSRNTEEVFISSDQLEHGRNTVDTVIHEIAHHTSRAEDGEEAYNAAMTQVAGQVVEATARGYFDEFLKDPNFVW